MQNSREEAIRNLQRNMPGKLPALGSGLTLSFVHIRGTEFEGRMLVDGRKGELGAIILFEMPVISSYGMSKKNPDILNEMPGGILYEMIKNIPYGMPGLV